MPPLGLGYLASVLRQNGFKVKILDCEALRLNMKQAAEEVFSFGPDYVGITAVTMAIHSAAGIAEALKQKNAKLRIILGGVQLSALPEETMRLYPHFDIGVIGEGEETCVELLNELSGCGRLEKVKGIIYRENGRLVKTPARPFIEDLNTLPPPAWDLFPELRKYYKPSVFGFMKLPCMSLISARGCLGRCSFCSKGSWGRSYREHSAEYVMGMIRELYHKYGIRDVVIYDDTFGVNQKRLAKLCEMLIREKLRLVWSCNFRVEMANKNVLSLMKKAGCWGVAYGIESCSQEVLDFLQKDIKLEMIAAAMRMTKEAGLVSKGYIMVGTLADTVQSIRKTLESVLRLDLDILTVNSFTPFPGSLDYHRAEKYGTFKRDWSLLNQHNLVFVPFGMTQAEVEGYIRLITRKFYLRPKVLFRYMKMSLNPNHLRLLLKGLISLLKFINPKTSFA